MGISVPRLVLSGLVAGFVVNVGELAVNVWVLGDAWTEALSGLGISMDLPSLILWGIGSFVLGIVGMWIYVAIRPTYTAGAKSAVRAGVALWAVTYLYVVIGLMGTLTLPRGLLLVALVWGLVEMVLAVYVGAWLYRSGELAEAA